MAIAQRTATTSWTGNLPQGSGELTGTSSGVLDSQSVTWASRTEAPGGKTSPEELLAAAHSSCFSMAFAMGLGQLKHEPEHLDVTAVVTLDEVDETPTVTTSELTVRGSVPGLSAEDFQKAADDAAKGCPVSRLFASATITVDAQLND